MVFDEIILIAHRGEQHLRQHVLVGKRHRYAELFPQKTFHFREGPVVGFRQKGGEEGIVAVGPPAAKFLFLFPRFETFFVDFRDKGGGIPGVRDIVFVDEREGDQHRIFSERKPRIGIDMSEPIPGE